MVRPGHVRGATVKLIIIIIIIIIIILLRIVVDKNNTFCDTRLKFFFMPITE